MKKRTIGLLLLLFILLASSQVYSQEKLPNPGEFYDTSMALYHKGNCGEAIQGFLTIIRSAPASKLVSYSRYMIGLCYLKMEKYEEAIRQFELYLKDYPESDRGRGAERGIQIAKDRLKEKGFASPDSFRAGRAKTLSRREEGEETDLCSGLLF